MSEVAFYGKIPKSKAEIPALVISVIGVFVIFAFHYGFFGWLGGGIALALGIALLFAIYQKRKGDYFFQVDDEGVSWREHIFSSYKYIPWKYIQRIDYLNFEINFMLKETAQVVSFATSGLSEEDTERMKQAISDTLKERIENEK